MFCTNCGTKINDGDSFCTNCGMAINESASVDNGTNSKMIFEIKDIGFLKCVKDYSDDTNVEDMNTIVFGQNENCEPIEWMILEKKNNAALLLSKYVLTMHSYNDEHVNITWEKSAIRKWLNSNVINNIIFFEENELSCMLTTNVINSDNLVYNTIGGNNTEDKLFLLSINEVMEYLSREGQRKAFYKENNDYQSWWLRSPGSKQWDAADIDSDGKLHSDGLNVNYDFNGIRPALWIKY